MDAAETHETFHQESGMRYQVSSRPDSERESGLFVTAARRSGPLASYVPRLERMLLDVWYAAVEGDCKAPSKPCGPSFELGKVTSADR